MKKLVSVIVGVLITILVTLFGLCRLAVEIIGSTTSPDDAALLAQRVPKVLEWLFSTPWPVPTVILFSLGCFAGWLLYSGLRGAAYEPDVARDFITKTDAEKLINDFRRSVIESFEGTSINSEVDKLKIELSEINGTIESILQSLKMSSVPVFPGQDALSKVAAWRRVNAATRYIVDQARFELAQTVAVEVRELIDNIENKPKFIEDVFSKKRIGRVLNKAEGGLSVLGFTATEIEDFGKESKSLIIADAKYLNLNDDTERSKWTTGEDKRQYFLTLAKMRAILDVVGEMKFPKPSLTDLVQNAQEDSSANH